MAEFEAQRAERRLFDRAVVYFNHGAFFEAHEDWEVLWHEAQGDPRRRLQGLIQVAAAFVHFERGFHATGFVKLVRQGLTRFGTERTTPWGIDAGRLLDDLAPWAEHAERVAAGAPLREGAPPLPRIAYVEGVDPDPALPDEDAEVNDAR